MNDTKPRLPSPPPEQPSRLDRLFRSLRRRPPKRRALGAGMALYLLSPIVAELCSGSTSAFNYIFIGWMLTLMYGGGAILIREFTLRWGKGWPTILVLGVAYGIAEEGIAVRTFVDRTAPVVQPLGSYGWFGGVNWVFSAHLALYHAIISIAIPIFLVMLAYPGRRNEPWVSNRWLAKAAAGYVGIHIFWLLVYQRPVEGTYIVGAMAVIVALIVVARLLPAAIELPKRATRRPASSLAASGSPGASPAPTPRRVAVVAFVATFIVFWMDWGKGLGLPAAGAVAVMAVTSGVAGLWFVRGSRRAGWTDRQRFAIAAGIFFFLPVFSPFIELSGSRGQLIVGIVSGWLFVRQWRRLRAREAAATAAPEPIDSPSAVSRSLTASPAQVQRPTETDPQRSRRRNRARPEDPP